MAEAVLRALLARRRRRRRRPPSWWLALAWLVWSIAFAVFDAAIGQAVYCAAMACYAAFWWRSLHHPPYYFACSALGWAFAGTAVFLTAVL